MKNKHAQEMGRLSAQARDTSSEAMRALVMKRHNKVKVTKEITIQKGWYWSAGTTYGWSDDYSREGVGLNKDLFDADTIIVTVKSKTGNSMKYELDAKKGLEFIREHKSFKTIGTVKVGFVPRSLMKEI